ncbi:MAG: WD40 repeat domain-containing protein [Polyangiales bacterium]
MATPKRTAKKPAKKPSPKKTAAKKPAAKKPAAKKPAAKKPAAKKPAAKKTVAKKTVAKKKTAAKKKRRAAWEEAPLPKPIALTPLGDVPEITLRESGETLTIHYEAAPAQPLKGEVLEGHTAFVQAFAFSRDGRVLVTGSEDATIRVWDVATKTCLRTLTAHTSAVNCVCFTPDGARLVSGSDDCTIKVWNPETWEVERTLTGSNGYVSEVHPAGEGRVASSGNDGTIRLWELATGACLREMHQGSWVNAMDASPDGRFALASSTDNVMRLWDLSTGEVAKSLLDASALNVGTVMGLIVAGENRSGVGHASFARHVVWSADGARFYSSSKELIEWDAATATERARLDGNGWEITGFAFVPGTREVVVSSQDAILVYDFDARKLLAAAPFAHGGNTHMVAVSPDGRLVACGSEKGPVGLWALDDLRAGAVPDRHVALPHAVAVTADGAFALSGGSDRTTWWRDLGTGASSKYAFADGLFVSPVLFTRDGRRALAMNDKATMAVFDARTGRLQGTGRFADTQSYRPFLKLRELRDGRWLVGSVGGPLTVWDLDALDKGPETFKDEAGHVVALELDPEGQVAVTAQYHMGGLAEVQAWNLSTRTLRWHAKVPTQGYASGVKIVGSRVVVGTSKGALLTLSLHDGALLGALSISPDEYLMGMTVTGPTEVVVLNKSPVRVDIAEGRVIERIANVPEHFYQELEGERRALRITAESVAVVDLVARTITPPLSLGRITSITPTAGSPFLAMAPMTPERTGTVTVLRREAPEPYAVQGPTLEPLEAPENKPSAKKPAARTSRRGGKPATVKAPGRSRPAKKLAKKRVRWVPTYSPPKKGVTYRYGRWTFTCAGASKRDVVLWNEGARTAFEFIAQSNGWWHMLHDGTEYVIWPTDGGDPQNFFSRPWIDALPEKIVEVRDGERYEICQFQCGTTLAFDGSELRVTFYDKRVLTIPKDGDLIDFDGRRGERIYTRSR